MVEYKVVETSEVTEESIERILNEWSSRGWSFEGMHFVIKESARRPSMAFVIFVRPLEEAGAGPGPGRGRPRGG